MEDVQQRIEADREAHPGCSYSTVRSSFSSFLNGASKAETLTRIIRNCQGEAPVEIYSHQETNDHGGSNIGSSGTDGSSNSRLPRALPPPSHPHQGDPHAPPALPSPFDLAPFLGQGEQAGDRDFFTGMVEDMMSSVLGGIFQGVFPPPLPMQPGAPPPHGPHGGPPAPPHAFPRGGWQPRAGGGGGGDGGRRGHPGQGGDGGGDVTEI